MAPIDYQRETGRCAGGRQEHTAKFGDGVMTAYLWELGDHWHIGHTR